METHNFYKVESPFDSEPPTNFMLGHPVGGSDTNLWECGVKM